MKEWSEKLRTSGLKTTPQRLLILRVLEKMTDETHPTAEIIWGKASLVEPNITKATVYRNLKTLAGHGLINELYFRDGKTRFEPNTDHHHHFICLSCKSTEKIQVHSLDGLLKEVEGKRNVVSHHFEFFGYCAKCQKKHKGDFNDE